MQEKEKKSAREREMPRTDELMGIIPIVFAVVTFIDIAFLLGDIIARCVPWWIRFPCGGFIMVVAIYLIFTSHKILFSNGHEPPQSLTRKGILNRTRNPMYLGILLVFAAITIITFSVLGLIVFLVYIPIINKMATYEENILEGMFGDEFQRYKKDVPKWIPRRIR